MMIEVKYFSKTTQITYKTINIILIALFLVLFIIDGILIGLESVGKCGKNAMVNHYSAMYSFCFTC